MNKTILHSCVTGKRLLPYVKNVTFQGISSKISFDVSGDMTGQYDIYQYFYGKAPEEHVKVGTWDIETESIVINSSKVVWNKTIDLFGPDALNDIPESVCSKPCKQRQYKIQQELHCCWQCLYCKSNEYILNGTGCATCPSLTWPDDENATECIDIPHTYMDTSDPITITLLLVTSIGIINSESLYFPCCCARQHAN